MKSTTIDEHMRNDEGIIYWNYSTVAEPFSCLSVSVRGESDQLVAFFDFFRTVLPNKDDLDVVLMVKFLTDGSLDVLKVKLAGVLIEDDVVLEKRTLLVESWSQVLNGSKFNVVGCIQPFVVLAALHCFY